jgi:hypothetical protein
MLNMDWKKAIENWRRLTPKQRFQRHLAAIPRHVALSMAMEGEPVDEELVREQLVGLMSSNGLPELEAVADTSHAARHMD